MTFKEFMQENGYDLITTFWEDFSIADNVPMERGGIVAFLLRTMNIFWELLKIQKNENGKII